MASDKQRLLAGEPYLAGAPDLVADRLHARLLTERLNATSAAEPNRRRAILAGLLGVVGDRTEVLSPFACDYGYQISIGARTFINFGAVILDAAPVSIGDDVQIGPGVLLVTPTHPLDPVERRSGLEWGAPIAIQHDAWLATGVIVWPGGDDRRRLRDRRRQHRHEGHAGGPPVLRQPLPAGARDPVGRYRPAATPPAAWPGRACAAPAGPSAPRQRTRGRTDR